MKQIEKIRTEMNVRPLRLEDLKAVMEIEPAAFGQHHWSKESFINELNNSVGFYFAAVESSTKNLIGYSGFWLIGEEAHITTLAVHPDYRRQHVGERLLINNVIQARKWGANKLTLEVRASNQAALQLYYKYGFESHGIRPYYYQDNFENALILWSEDVETQKFNALLNQRIAELQIHKEILEV